MPRGKYKFMHNFFKKESVQSFNVDNFSKFIKNVETCGFGKLAGYKINLPFKAGGTMPGLYFCELCVTINYLICVRTNKGCEWERQIYD